MAKPHAVVLPLDLQGHIKPTMHLANILAAKGFIITFVNTHTTRKRILAESQSQLTSHQDEGLDIRFVEIPDGLSPDHSQNPVDIAERRKKIMGTMGACFEKLVESLLPKDPPITCIISSSVLLFAQDVAKKFGIPYVAFWTQSVASYASILLVTKGFRPPTENPNLITCIPGTPPLKPSEMNTFLQSYDPSDFLFDFITRPFQSIGESAWILINSFDELEHEGVEALQKEHPICTVGPLLPSSFFDDSIHSLSDTADLWPAEHDCLSWLDTHPPASVLFVSFGSRAVLSVKQIEEIALGLEASQQPFLWAVRPDLMSGEPAAFPEGFLHSVKDRAAFVSWAPQLQVLSHKSLGGFFTHCGWNSTLESIAAGVPMLGWAHNSDQPMNRRCLVDAWKVGLSLEQGEDGLVTRMEVEKKVRDLMGTETGRELRERARRWRDAARKSAEEGGSSHKNLELFVDAMKSRASLG